MISSTTVFGKLLYVHIKKGTEEHFIDIFFSTVFQALFISQYSPNIPGLLIFCLQPQEL